MNKKIFIFGLIIIALMHVSSPAYAVCCPTCDCSGCTPYITPCTTLCGNCSKSQEQPSKQHFTDEMENHKYWMVEAFWKDREANTKPGLAAAMMLMASQLTTNAMHQVAIVGKFFDAKHQLETQRLFQTLTAEAHKDYHPSQELCNIGTVARPLAASDRKTDLAAQAFTRRSVDRQLLSANTLVMADGAASDQRGRLNQFIKLFCNPNDNSGNLDLLCKKGETSAANRNKDINYTTAIDAPLTLDIDLGDPEVSDDEAAIFALSANLISNEIMPAVEPETLMSRIDGVPGYAASASAYLDSRALVAKRSVAANSLSSIAALKVSGNPEARPFIYSLIEELSPEKFNLKEIQDLLGENPSYYAQMEILTKKIYQNPKFYSDLYDKPANVLRKDVAIQAAELMQKRDTYRSILRAESVLAVMLETALLTEQELLLNELNAAGENSNKSTPGLGN